jgi:hypothetical protein
MGKGKSKYDRDNTLIWVIISLLGIVMFQMYFTLQFKEKIREHETTILKLNKTISEFENIVDWERDARKQDIIDSKKNSEMYKNLIK